VDAFIENIQERQTSTSSILRREKDIFKEVVPMCETAWKLIGQVFPNPHQVMGKFVLNVYHSRLKDHVATKLAGGGKQGGEGTEAYLTNFYSLYSRTTKLTGELAHFSLGGAGGDQLFLTNLTKTIFKSYLDTYVNVECRFLNERCAITLQR